MMNAKISQKHDHMHYNYMNDVLKPIYNDENEFINDKLSYTINRIARPFYPCARGKAFKLKVLHEKTYLMRLINAMLNEHLFFMVTGHKFKVVAVDALLFIDTKTLVML